MLNATTVSLKPRCLLEKKTDSNSSQGKKLKRRLEDLERRAGSSSASPPQMHVELEQPERVDNTRRYLRSPEQESASDLESTDRHASPDGLHHQYTPPMQSEDEFHRYGNREVISRSPPTFSYHHNYPPSDDNLYPPFSQSQPYRTTTSRAEPYQEYLAPLPSMMLYNHPVKQEGLADDETMSPFSMSYAVMAGGIDMHHDNSYHHDSDPHVKSPNPSTLAGRKLTR